MTAARKPPGRAIESARWSTVRPTRGLLRALPAPAHLSDIYGSLMRRANVVGCYVSRKRRGGRRIDQPAIVCAVSQKVARGELDALDELVPRYVDWAVGRIRCRIFTDVVELTAGGRRTATPIAGPGDDVQRDAGRGTVGIALRHPIYGPVITTAGHVVSDQPGVQTFPAGQEPRVRLASSRGEPPYVEGSALRVVLTEWADYAIVSSTPAVRCGNLYRDIDFITHPYIPSPADIGQPLFILSAARPRSTRLTGLHATLPVDGGVLRDLLLTTFDSEGGDSGACLVDAERRVWGLLVGATVIEGEPHSMFISPLVPMMLEQAQYLA